MRNPFTAHPHDVGETYAEHAVFAVRYGLKMAAGGIAAVAHGIFPFLFRTTASRITDELKQMLDDARNRGRTAKGDDPR